MNSFVTCFSKELFQSLEEENLYPSHSTYENVYLEIYRVGEMKMKLLKRKLSARQWKSLLEGIGKSNAEGHCMRILGFGHHLSAFMVGPLQIDPGKKERVIRLGMLTNFIVAIYDCFLDLNKSKNPLPAWLLYLCSNKIGRIVARTIEPFFPVHTQIVARLVTFYFKDLNSLTSSMNRPLVKLSIYRSIKKMYEAEQQFGKTEERFTTYWLRKSALPFVTMGLPALLVAGDDKRGTAFKFIRNMYHLGEVFGLLDDVADLNQDRSTGQQNIVQYSLNQGKCEEEVIDEIKCRAIRLLVGVYSEIEKFNLDRNTNFYTFYWTPIICVIGWLGGQYQLSAETTSGDGRN